MQLPYTLAGRYKLTKQLGEGNFANAYQATDTRLHRQVAVKVLREQFAADPAFVTRFQREASTAANVHHPNVVQVFDHDQADGLLFIVMELVQGQDLKHLIRQHAPDPLPIPRAVAIIQDVLHGLEAIHRADIIHRDLKPQNVLIDQASGKAKVADFGIARTAVDSGLSRSGQAIGTSAYMAPEQITGQPISPATDLYAAGVMLFELLTGQLPFSGDNDMAVLYQQVHTAPPMPRQLNPAIPTHLEVVILRALAKDPATRYPSAEDMAVAIQQGPSAEETRLIGGDDVPTQTFNVGGIGAATGGPPNDPTERPVPPSSSSSGGWPRWALLPVFLVALAIIGFLLLNNRPPTLSATPAPSQPAAAVVPTPSPSVQPVVLTSPVPSATPSPTPSNAAVASPSESPSATPAPPPPPGTVLYQASWSSGMNGWTGPASWKTVNGMLVTDGTNGDNRWIRAPYEPSTANYAVEVEMQVVKNGSSGCFDPIAGILGRVGDQGGDWAGMAYPNVNWGGNKNMGAGSARLAAGEISCRVTDSTRQAFDSGTDWHTYRMELQGNTIKLLIDGGAVLTMTDNQFLDPGKVGLWVSGAQVNVRSFKVIAL